MGNSDHHHQINLFNPAWCCGPPPIKGNTRRKCSDFTLSSSSSSSSRRRTHDHHHASETNKLSSPRVACMGQIKRDEAFSDNSRSKRNRNRRSSSKVQDYFSVQVRRGIFINLDEPLPVVKHVAREASSVSLWTKRCGGDALQGIQLQQLNVCLDRTAV